MPMIEIPEDLAEQIADWIGVYGAHDECCSEKKPCRCCFTAGMESRIVRSVRNMDMLNSKEAPDGRE